MPPEFQNSQGPACKAPSTKSSRLRFRASPKIAIEGADHRYRDLRIENSLGDEHGDEVRLKKGAHVEVTVTAKDANGDN
jgi:hypothetical protein